MYIQSFIDNIKVERILIISAITAVDFEDEVEDIAVKNNPIS